MADTYENPATEPLKKASQAASLARGAVKAGKAISSAAKGAAAGGPYGALLGIAWENRNLVAKILVSAAVLFLIPIIILCMLPSVIFSSPNDQSASNLPVLSDYAEIQENIAEISNKISDILSVSLQNTLQAIGQDFVRSGADYGEIINPYESAHSYDVILFISQYCAYRSDDAAKISVSDMEAVLRKELDKLYSYTKEEEYRPVPTGTTPTDDTSTQPTQLEHWVIYTVVYNGESYFADEVFFLTEEQKSLAAEYARNLTLFLSDIST